MRWWTDLSFRVRALVDRRRMDRDLDEELTFHLEREAEKLVAQGMSAANARREAYRRFGGVERHRDQAREARGVRLLEDTVADARLAVRRMAASPGFSWLAVLTLGLGIGGTTSMFGVVNTLLLRALPYPDSDRLVWVASAAAITPQNLDEWRRGLRSIESLGGFDLRSGVLRGERAARNAVYMSVSDEYLRLLGAEPVLGRLWSVDEAVPAGPPVALVSHRVWIEELGGADIDGRSVTLDQTTFAVVGVLPSGFHNLDYDADLWLPVSRARGSLNVVARLRPGATTGDVQREIDAVLAARELMPSVDRSGLGAQVTSVRDQFVGGVRAPALVLFGAAVLVLMLACANVSALLLGRAAGRAQELALRSALGAPRSALVRQLLTESGVLAVCGGLCGLALSVVALRAMTNLAPPHLNRAIVGGVDLDPTVLGFTIAMTGLSTVLAGLVPAVLGARSTFTAARSTVSRHTRRWHEGLVAAEVSVALVLLVGTALLVRTYATLRPSDPGFDVEDRLVTQLTLPGLRDLIDNRGLSPATQANAELVRRLVSAIEASDPGAAAAAVTSLPLSGSVWSVAVVALDGTRLDGDGRVPVRIDFQPATPSYTTVIGMALARGRGLTDADARDSPPVVVVNESAAARLWPDAHDVVGRRLTLDPFGATGGAVVEGGGAPPLVDLEVVGVVRDVRSSGIHTRSRPEAYVSYWQFPWPLVHLVVHDPRGDLSSERLLAAVAELDTTMPLDDVTTVARIASRAVSGQRYETVLMGLFGGLAVALALTGCYGVMARSVAERTREIGVRIALGATGTDISALVGRMGSRLVAVGLATGSVLALALTRVLEGSLYGVSPTDPATFVAAAAAMAVATLAAAWLPARRAARIEPARTLGRE